MWLRKFANLVPGDYFSNECPLWKQLISFFQESQNSLEKTKVSIRRTSHILLRCYIKNKHTNASYSNGQTTIKKRKVRKPKNKEIIVHNGIPYKIIYQKMCPLDNGTLKN